MQNQDMNLLEEILAVPSQTIISERFAEEASASCNGECTGPGGCRGVSA